MDSDKKSTPGAGSNGESVLSSGQTWNKSSILYPHGPQELS